MAAASAAAILALGGVLHHDPPAASAGDVLPTAVAAELRANPRNVKALDTLGLAYQQRVRETGDATYYGKAEGILRESLSLAPHGLLATAALGQLALSRHRFREALAFGIR